jgi:hypothetical protein
MTEPTEDISGDIDPFAIEDEATVDSAAEDQTAETLLIKELRSYVKEAIDEHNSLDLIDLTEQAKMTATQQIAVHKLVVQHLRNINNTINNKVKEN